MQGNRVLALPKTVEFDVNNPVHRKAYLDFINTGRWTMKFTIEHPFTSIPSMIMYKLAALACKAEGAINPTRIMNSNDLTTETAVVVKTEQKVVKIGHRKVG